MQEKLENSIEPIYQRKKINLDYVHNILGNLFHDDEFKKTWLKTP